jgi:hypothetical protein
VNKRVIDTFKFNGYHSRGEKAKLTLWGDLAHYLSEVVIGNHKVLIITSTMVLSPRFKGKFSFVI